jgi:hypothetical protein
VSDQILLRFLSAGLINVGGDDAQLEKLKETAADLAAAVKETPSKAAPFALIAFDPEAPDEDPVVKEALQALQKRWATYVNTFSGKPVAVIRAILLDALVQAAGDDDKVGVAFVTSARNVLPLTEAGNERAIWADVVAMIEQRLDARAEAEWATPAAIVVPVMTFQAPAAINVGTPQFSVNKAAFKKRIEAAVGPHNAASQPTGGNPNWPNNPQPWANEFSTRLTDAFIEALEAVADGSAIEAIDLSGPLTSLAQAVSAHVEGTLKAVSDATAGLQRRTNLIWWKETLYSPSARISYRGMHASSAAALMAFDLHRQVPTFSPANVAAFLHETVLSLPSLDAAEERPILDLLKEAWDSEQLKPLRQAAVELVSEPAGRGPILGLLGFGAGRSPLDERAFREQVGVPATTPLTPPEWATWLFRELQAARAAQESTDVNQRRREPQ